MILTESVKFVEALVTFAIVLCNATCMVDVGAIKKPDLLPVPPVGDCALAVVAFALGAGHSFRKAVEERFLIM